MNLEENWAWQSRKLSCRVHPESGNPAGDDLRARFVELAGKDLEEMTRMYDTLGMMKETKKRKEVEKKGVHIDHKADKKFNEVLTRKHIVGATQLALEEMQKKEDFLEHTVTQKNLKKQFNRLPVSPPPRVLLEIQRERSKPPTTVDTEDIAVKQAKLEKKLEKQRLKRMAAMNEDDTSQQGRESAKKFSEALMRSTFKSQNSGDIFSTHGDYMDSMMYMSRMAGNLEKSTRLNNPKSQSGTDAFDLKPEDQEKDNKEEKQGDGEDENSNMGNTVTDLNAKLHCVINLANWARNPGNATRLAQEGGIRAIITLTQEQDERILKYCSAAFRFMSEIPLLANNMIDEGAVSAISDVVKVPVDEFASTNLAVALVNLTRLNGKEAYLVEGSMVLALQNIIMNRPELSSLCSRGLYNLTCVDGMYPLMERLIRSVISVSSSNISSVKHICAAALCNLSDLKLMRARLVEEGTISVLGTIARHAPTRTRRVCGVIMQNLSATKSCRVEMVLRSTVHVAHNLSSDKDPIILRCVGLTLARLSTEPQNSQRIIQELGVAALCNIAMKFSTISGITQPISTAFQLLARQESVRRPIVEKENCVTAIAQLLHNSEDKFTLQNSLYALCNLMLEPNNHLPVVQQGLILTLISMSTSEDETVRDLCALGFYNLSRSDDSRKHLVNAGAVTSLINLTSQKEAATKQRCAHALCNVCSYEQGVPRMVADGIIPALVRLLSEDNITIHYACAALCRLGSNLENSLVIADSGGIPSLVQGTLQGDMITKQFCGAVLSALSLHDTCKVTLCDSGAIAALKSLAELNDDASKQRCLVAFANISCEESVRTKMVEEGVVSVIAGLIGNSYQEKNYICCAKALCNLACAESTRTAVAEQGGMHTLLMISMVHSVDRQTKVLCVNALCNLLDDSTVQFMVDEGISSSVANLCKLDDDTIVHLCAKMYNYLTKFGFAMTKMMEKTNLSFSAINKMLENSDPDTKMVAARTTANLALCTDVEVSSSIIDAGGLDILLKGSVLTASHASMQCIAALYAVSGHEKRFLTMMGKLGVHDNMVQLCLESVNQNEPKSVMMCKILATLSHYEASRKHLQRGDSFASSLLQLIKANTSLECGRWLVQSLRYFCDGTNLHLAMVNEGLINALTALHKLGDKSSMISSGIVESIRLLLEGDKGVCENLASPALITMFATAVKDQAKACSKPNNVLYNVAKSMLMLVESSTKVRQILCQNERAVEVMVALLKHQFSSDLAVLALFHLLNDSRTRQPLSTFEIGVALSDIMKSKPHKTTLYNAVSVIYAMTKYPVTRGFLADDPINLDTFLNGINTEEDAKMKANVHRAIKNLTADSNEAIEEGVVASLIAISLEGKQTKAKVEEDTKAVDVHAIELAPLPDIGLGNFDTEQFFWYCEKTVKVGGEAGAGPDHPEPPHMNEDKQKFSQFEVEEVDASEVEGKAKMGFAKMQIPNEAKTAHLLMDEDFEITEEDSHVEDGSTVADMEPGAVMPGGGLDDNSIAMSGDKPGVGLGEGSITSSGVMPGAPSGSLEKSDSVAESKGGGEYENDFEMDAGLDEEPAEAPRKSPAKKKQTNRVSQGQDQGSRDVGEKAAQLGLYK